MEQCRHREPWNSARDPIVYVLRSSSSFRQNRHFCWSLLSVTDLYKAGFKSNVKSWFYYTLSGTYWYVPDRVYIPDIRWDIHCLYTLSPCILVTEARSKSVKQCQYSLPPPQSPGKQLVCDFSRGSLLPSCLLLHASSSSYKLMKCVLTSISILLNTSVLKTHYDV